MVKDVLMKDPTAYHLISGEDDPTAYSLIVKDYLSSIKVNIFRFTQSLDDPTLLFWRPFALDDKEWEYIFFLKLTEGKLHPYKDFISKLAEG